MASERLKEGRFNRSSAKHEMEIEYDKWKNTVVSILNNMKEGSSATTGRQKIRKSSNRHERIQLDHLSAMQSEAMALKKLLEQRPTDVKRQGQLCPKHSESLRHKVTKIEVTV